MHGLLYCGDLQVLACEIYNSTRLAYQMALPIHINEMSEVHVCHIAVAFADASDNVRKKFRKGW